ncbi:MAG: YceI family protein [Desulfocapsaceae bacterium]|nr:YceI family protein [Desulfocapsaceae bacterium]
MIQRLLIIVLVLLLNVSIANAEVFIGECSIRFFGDATLHGFDGKVACQPFTLTGEKETKIIRQPVVIVRVDSMDTDNDSRNEKMRNMFDSKKFPVIEGLFGDLNPTAVLQIMASPDAQPAKLEFDLKIRERLQRVQAEVTDFNVTSKNITFTMKFNLSLASFELEPPAGAFGILKVADRVDVEIDAVLQRK